MTFCHSPRWRIVKWHFFERLTFYPLERDDFVLTCHFSACKALCYHSSVAPEGRRWVYLSCLLCKYLYRGEKRSPPMAATTTPPSANFSFNALALTGQLFHHHSSNWGEWRQKPWHSWGWGKFGTLELTGYDASTWCGRIRRERQPTLTTMLPTPHALFFLPLRRSSPMRFRSPSIPPLTCEAVSLPKLKVWLGGHV